MTAALRPPKRETRMGGLEGRSNVAGYKLKISPTKCTAFEGRLRGLRPQALTTGCLEQPK